MSVINNSLLLTAPAGGGGYQVQRSIRLNSADSASLSRTPSVAGNRKTWTWAGWVKKTGTSSGNIFAASPDNWAGQYFYAIFSGGGVLQLQHANTTLRTVTTIALYRDPGAWFHLVIAFDTTQATAANRILVYVNGVKAEFTGSASYPNLNEDTLVNSTCLHRISGRASGDFNGYLAEVHFIDGQALTPSSFTETDATTGQLIPKAFTGSYGTNGWKLNFSDNSTAAALGTDTSGNGNTWTVNNFTVASNVYSANYTSTFPGGNTYFGDGWRRGFDANLDNFVNVYATSETTLTLPAGVTWSSKIRVRIFGYSPSVIKINGTTLSISYTTSPAWYDVTSQLGSSGTLSTIYINSVSPGDNYLGFCAVELDNVVLYDVYPSNNDSLVDTPTSYGTDTGVGGSVRGNYATLNPLAKGGDIQAPTNGNLQVTSSGSLYGLILGTIGMSSGKWYWEVTTTSANCATGIATNQANLASYGGADAYSWVWASYSGGSSKRNNNTMLSYGSILTNGDVVGVAFDADNGTLTFYKNNVSQGAAYTGLAAGTYLPVLGDETASANIDLTINFGQRAFAYTAPSGFKALCDTNLPTPVIAKPNTVMDVALWTGNGSARSITGLAFNPDFVWIKGRSGATDHALYDAVRGVQKDLVSNSTAAETTQTQGLTAFNSDGFSLGTLAKVNTSSATYAGWAWDAGTSTVTNTAGSISSQVRANASAGFSVVTFTMGSGSNTVGHGLNVVPGLVISKARNTTSNWWVFMDPTLGSDKHLSLQTTNAVATLARGTSTSSLLAVDNNFFSNTATYVAYCFAPVSGYSSFGSYLANANSDGPFVYTGFKPRFVLCKLSSAAGADWLIFDTARSPYNVVQANLRPNTLGAEESALARIDILSNGFKVRAGSGVEPNGTNGNTYIYAAWAESPFQYARAR